MIVLDQNRKILVTFEGLDCYSEESFQRITFILDKEYPNVNYRETEHGLRIHITIISSWDYNQEDIDNLLIRSNTTDDEKASDLIRVRLYFDYKCLACGSFVTNKFIKCNC